MGLDMNIYKNKTVEYDRDMRERTVKISEVLYLRKANQIHHYIVENFADGKDECQEISMDIEDIKKLNELCKRIVKESKLEGDWIYYDHTCSRWLDKGNGIALAEKKGNKFVKVGECSASMLNVGDYIYQGENNADKVESIEKRDDRYFVQCGSEYWTEIIKNPELAKNELPTQEGFFFGDTNYTKFYLDDLKEYSRQADEIIADYENEIKSGVKAYDIDYTYQASW